MIKKSNDKYIILFAAVIIATVLVFNGFSSTKYPKTVQELSETSVKIASAMGSASGVIISSSKDGSLILTNGHVCSMFPVNGYTIITEDDKVLKINNYKKYDKHDLCLIKVLENLNVTIKIADKPLKKYENIKAVGHPLGLPTIVSAGNFSGDYTSVIYDGDRPCTDQDTDLSERDAMSCLFTGKIPMFSTFEGKVLSILIAGGSSGSGVFNDRGELCGVLFAARSEVGTLGFAASVPLYHIQDFIKNQNKYSWEL